MTLTGHRLTSSRFVIEVSSADLPGYLESTLTQLHGLYKVLSLYLMVLEEIHKFGKHKLSLDIASMIMVICFDSNRP